MSSLWDVTLKLKNVIVMRGKLKCGTTYTLYMYQNTYEYIIYVYSMPHQIYDFVPICTLEKLQIEDRGKKLVDVCGIIKSADTEFSTLKSKATGKDMYKVCRVFNGNKNEKLLLERTRYC